MKKWMKISASLAIITFANSVSMAQTCAEDVDCQNAKLEAMAETRQDKVLSEINTLKKKIEALMLNADSAGDYVGSARAMGRIEEIENEATSISRTANDSAVSIHGRTMQEISEEVNYIKDSYKASGVM